jgi:ribose transport system ATP-binding protein
LSSTLSGPTAEWSLELIEAAKSFGLTRAVDNVNLSIAPGRVLGVIGPNGAGKSTLMRLIAGEVSADAGRLMVGGTEVHMGRYSPRAAKEIGVRVVHQELSLCTNLRVFENFLVEFGENSSLRWRHDARARAAQALDDAFPGSGISPTSEVSKLSLAQQQMVEIARAASTPDLRVLILDEPTSALPADRVKQLRQLLDSLRQRRVATILITHRLSEILELTDAVVVMRNGRDVWRANTAEVSREQLVAVMSSGIPGSGPQGAVTTPTTDDFNGASFNGTEIPVPGSPATAGRSPRRLLDVTALTDLFAILTFSSMRARSSASTALRAAVSESFSARYSRRVVVVLACVIERYVLRATFPSSVGIVVGRGCFPCGLSRAI